MTQIPDLGDFAPSKKLLIVCCTLSTVFLGFVIMAYQLSSFSQGSDSLSASIVLLVFTYFLLRATFSNRSIKHGYITHPGVFFGTKRATYEQIESFGLYKVKQRYGEQDSIQFFTYDGKKIGFLKGNISDNDYQRIVAWATTHFQKR